jgi:hypothetical protein
MLLLVRITACIAVFLLAGALSFDEKIRRSSPPFWFGLRNDGIFHLWAPIQRKIDVSPAFGEKDPGLGTCKPWSEQAGGLEAFLHGAAQNFEVFQIFKIKNKKIKTYSGWYLFKGFSMIPLSCRSNLAGRYL